MRGPHNILRVVRTGATFIRTGAMVEALQAMDATPSMRFAAGVLSWPFAWLGLKGDRSLPPVPRALTALGPAYIKFGQILSTRPDLVGNDLAQQLRILQDKLPPFPTQVAKRIIEGDFDAPIETLFSEFSEPVAAASIAQVHKARFASDGRQLAVKVLRPGIERAFQKDIDAFYLIAWLIETLSPASRRLRPQDVVEHFEGTVLRELDLRIEASAAGEFAANTSEDNGWRVPAVEWYLSSRHVMTLAWADGIPMGDVAAIDAAGIDRKELAERVLQMFLNHALRDGFFHADMHQGNLKIGSQKEIVALDFGIMGRLDEYTRRVWAEILIGFIRKDYKRVAEVHFEAGYVPSDRDTDEFAQALRSVGEPIFDMDASKISMGKLLAYLFEVTERFGMQTRTELILLQRTMVVVEGVARSLDPNINIWQVSRPVLESYIARNGGPRALAMDIVRTARILARFGPRLPDLAEKALLSQNLQGESASPRNHLEKWLYAAVGTGVGAGLVLLGSLL